MWGALSGYFISVNSCISWYPYQLNPVMFCQFQCLVKSTMCEAPQCNFQIYVSSSLFGANILLSFLLFNSTVTTEISFLWISPVFWWLVCFRLWTRNLKISAAAKSCRAINWRNWHLLNKMVPCGCGLNVEFLKFKFCKYFISINYLCIKIIFSCRLSFRFVTLFHVIT